MAVCECDHHKLVIRLVPVGNGESEDVDVAVLRYVEVRGVGHVPAVRVRVLQRRHIAIAHGVVDHTKPVGEFDHVFVDIIEVVEVGEVVRIVRNELSRA